MAYTIDDVSLVRNVNGENVPLSVAERQLIADEWNATEVTQMATANVALAEANGRALAKRQLEELALTNPNEALVSFLGDL